MADRQQQQAEALSARLDKDGRAGRDLAWIVAFSVVIALTAYTTDFFSRVTGWAGELSDTNLNGVLALGVLIPLAATFYAIRRYRDASAARDALAELAQHDRLTGLPNRSFLGDGFTTILRRADRAGGRVAVLFVDLDGFKKINDAYGFDIGDDVMRVLADRLRQVAGPDDTVVRYGGDEFVLICAGMTTAQGAERTARQVVGAIEEPVAIGGDRLRLSASVGVAIAEAHCKRPDDVLHDADVAMYQAKALGAGRYALFDRSMRDRITPSTIDRRLRDALASGEFRLVYQPIVSLWTKRMVGVEALLCWHDPERGVVRPSEFLPALEESGLIVPLGNWILEEVCAQSRRWQDEHPDRPPLNIKCNVSARQLAQANFVDHLATSLERSGADPAHLTLEISEGALMYDVASAWSTLRSCRHLGVSLALDDFGTGYSSLGYLRQFNLDLLKIDKSFVDGLGRSREDTTIIEHVIGMAKALGIVTVAEGVETEQQVDLLRSLNCDLAQGWYFSNPQPPSVISHLLTPSGTPHEWRPADGDEDDLTGPDADAAAPPVDRFAGSTQDGADLDGTAAGPEASAEAPA